GSIRLAFDAALVPAATPPIIKILLFLTILLLPLSFYKKSAYEFTKLCFVLSYVDETDCLALQSKFLEIFNFIVSVIH
ncbi:MAG: hypothetical protein WCF07_00055, partial [Nitrososphaeraceae archaeon]